MVKTLPLETVIPVYPGSSSAFQCLLKPAEGKTRETEASQLPSPCTPLQVGQSSPNPNDPNPWIRIKSGRKDRFMNFFRFVENGEAWPLILGRFHPLQQAPRPTPFACAQAIQNIPVRPPGAPYPNRENRPRWTP